MSGRKFVKLNPSGNFDSSHLQNKISAKLMKKEPSAKYFQKKENLSTSDIFDRKRKDLMLKKENS